MGALVGPSLDEIVVDHIAVAHIVVVAQNQIALVPTLAVHTAGCIEAVYIAVDTVADIALVVAFVQALVPNLVVRIVVGYIEAGHIVVAAQNQIALVPMFAAEFAVDTAAGMAIVVAFAPNLVAHIVVGYIEAARIALAAHMPVAPVPNLVADIALDIVVVAFAVLAPKLVLVVQHAELEALALVALANRKMVVSVEQSAHQIFCSGDWVVVPVAGPISLSIHQLLLKPASSVQHFAWYFLSIEKGHLATRSTNQPPREKWWQMQFDYDYYALSKSSVISPPIRKLACKARMVSTNTGLITLSGSITTVRKRS